MNQVLRSPIEGNFRIHNDKVLLDPNFVPKLDGIRVLRRGWLLGELVKGRFEPAQSFAMGLEKTQIKNTITFEVDDPNVLKYLKCETLHLEKANGWYVVCLGDFPLGWAKLVNGQLKNKYPPAWRMV
jgi:NOL1/NOP2/fmu family ribosome biogenesis protein